MPLQTVKKDGKTCYRWGNKGKIYCGKDGKKKAIKQGIVIEGPENFKKIMETEGASLSTEDIVFIKNMLSDKYKLAVEDYLENKNCTMQ